MKFSQFWLSVDANKGVVSILEHAKEGNGTKEGKNSKK